MEWLRPVFVNAPTCVSRSTRCNTAHLPSLTHPPNLLALQLYELAASGVRERAKLRQEVNEVQHELQGTRRQLHAFMASLMQLKNSMASAGEGDLEHALELLQSSSYSQSLNSKLATTRTETDAAALRQIKQMQQYLQ